MRVIAWVGLVTGACLCLMGCTRPPAGTIDPARVQRVSKQAGYVAVMGWVIADKPSDELIEVVQPLVGDLSQAISKAPANGFAALLPMAKKHINARLPEEKKAERLAAVKVAEIVLTQLDDLFAKHPEWKDNTTLIEQSLGKFLAGANQALKDYLED